jgi:hypothetical protein
MDVWFRYFGVNWYIFMVLVFCTNKNLATLLRSRKSGERLRTKEIQEFFSAEKSQIGFEHGTRRNALAG